MSGPPLCLCLCPGGGRLADDVRGAAGAIWTSEMPVKLAEHLPDVDQATRDSLFGSITDVMAFPFGDPTREGVIAGASRPPPYLVVVVGVVVADRRTP